VGVCGAAAFSGTQCACRTQCQAGWPTAHVSPFRALLSLAALIFTPPSLLDCSRYGTIHSYNYMSDCEDFRSYPLGKFVSEFGESRGPGVEPRCADSHAPSLRSPPISPLPSPPCPTHQAGSPTRCLRPTLRQWTRSATGAWAIR
jgi:hypothetical protein